jgi:recombination protein RecT
MSEEKSQALAVRGIFSMLESADFKQKLSRAIPETLKVDRVVQLAYTMLRNDKALASCTPLSILASVASASQLGLELDRTLGHAYLVKFGDECSLIVGYRGFMHLMYQSGAITEVSSEVVRPGDKFRRTLGTDRGLYHEPGPTPKKDDPDKWLGAYAVAKLITGNVAFEYMDREHVEFCRNRSKSWRAYVKEQKQTIWMTDTEEMWRKTPIRKLAKRMPVSVTDKRATLVRAVTLDEYGERKGLLVPTDTGWEVNPNPPEDANGNEAPLTPTEDLSGPLAESIEAVEERQARVAKKNKAVAPKTKVPPTPPESRIDDPYLSGKQQADIFNFAAQAGWKVPEELNGWIQKRFKVKTIRECRQSMYEELLKKARGEAK